MGVAHKARDFAVNEASGIPVLRCPIHGYACRRPSAPESDLNVASPGMRDFLLDYVPMLETMPEASNHCTFHSIPL